MLLKFVSETETETLSSNCLTVPFICSVIINNNNNNNNIC